MEAVANYLTLDVGRLDVSRPASQVQRWTLDDFCYVSDLEEGEKTLLLHEGEGKLSRVRSRLIYRFSRGLSVHRAGLHSGAEADRSGTVTQSLYVLLVSQPQKGALLDLTRFSLCH